MLRLRIDQCWKPKRVGLRVSEDAPLQSRLCLDAVQHQIGFSLIFS